MKRNFKIYRNFYGTMKHCNCNWNVKNKNIIYNKMIWKYGNNNIFKIFVYHYRHFNKHQLIYYSLLNIYCFNLNYLSWHFSCSIFNKMPFLFAIEKFLIEKKGEISATPSTLIIKLSTHKMSFIQTSIIVQVWLFKWSLFECRMNTYLINV